tara:strand:- start:509 stop:742 length:234 start_codon:yes stop_codon:yes gene_type:complete
VTSNNTTGQSLTTQSSDIVDIDKETNTAKGHDVPLNSNEEGSMSQAEGTHWPHTALAAITPFLDVPGGGLPGLAPAA